jgi:Protein of unknown function (DUF2735)
LNWQKSRNEGEPTMGTIQRRQSAQILTFPTAARAAATNLSKKAKFAAEIASLRSQKIVSGDSWYHEAAIEEETRDRKN